MGFRRVLFRSIDTTREQRDEARQPISGPSTQPISVVNNSPPLVKKPTSMAANAPTTLPCQKVEMNTGPIIAASRGPEPRMPNQDSMDGGAYIIISRPNRPNATTATRLMVNACAESTLACLFKARRRSCEVAEATVCSIELAVDFMAKMMKD